MASSDRPPLTVGNRWMPCYGHAGGTALRTKAGSNLVVTRQLGRLELRAAAYETGSREHFAFDLKIYRIDRAVIDRDDSCGHAIGR